MIKLRTIYLFFVQIADLFPLVYGGKSPKRLADLQKKD